MMPGVFGMKLMMAAFDALAIGALIALLRIVGRDPAELLIYAWLPLPVWEFAGNAHVDGAAAGLLALALLLAVRRRSVLDGHRAGRRHADEVPARRGVPGVLATARLAVAGRLRGDVGGVVRAVCLGRLAARWVSSAATPARKVSPAATAYFCCNCSIASCRCLTGHPGSTSRSCCACSACSAVRFVFVVHFRRRQARALTLQAHQAVILGAVLLVALSPHYPWYFGWLAPLACLAPFPAVLWMLAAAPLLAHGAFEYLAVPGAVYGPAAALVLFELYRRWTRRLTSPQAVRSASMTVVKDPRRYFEAVETRATQATAPPVCLYLEVTNRCNLLCETCPRTFETLEPPADMSWELFTSIVDQVPDVSRVVLHGVGEPMLVKALPRMIRYLKERGIYVLFNTNGTLLSPKKHQEMIDTGLDELRVSLDAADAKSFLAVRGKNFFDRIVRNVRSFTELQRASGATSPRVSLWLTGLKETIEQFRRSCGSRCRWACARCICSGWCTTTAGYGLARPESSLFETLRAEESRAIEAATALARELGVELDASGATEPGLSLKRQDETQPWSACRRPWSLMYFTAHGRALPCCMAPFSARGYDSYTLGDATQQTLREIWNGAAYRNSARRLLSDAPPKPCAGCGMRWSL